MAKTAAALHILVKEEQLALDLLEQIKNGADFGKLGEEALDLPVRQTRWRFR